MDKRTGGAGALFTMVGTVVGAGFVSGRELLQFFGSFRLSLVCMAGLLFFAGFFLFVRLGKKFGGFEGAMKGAFGKFAPFVKAVVLFGSFVSCAGMLSASNALLPRAVPFLSLAFLAVACLVAERGMRGVGALNLIVMPALLLCVAGLVFFRGALSRPEPPAADFPDLLSVVLYVGMNTFLSMPVLCELGAHAKSSGGFLCAASAFVIAAAVGLVLSAVCSDKNSYPYDLPLAYVLGGSRLFSALASGGMLTTLVSSFYPLYAPAGKKWGAGGKIVLVAAAELCSFVRFRSIVAVVYPMLGAFGTLACAVAAGGRLCGLRRAGKRRKKVNFSVKEKKEFY